jgi:hypothetical protein
MFCPKCKDEYRPGFTRCATCDVDLVDDLSAVQAAPVTDGPAPVGVAGAKRSPVSMRDYCGFTSLDEARKARDLLRTEGVASEIAICDSPDSGPTGPTVEEYWLRVEPRKLKIAMQLLGYDEAEAEAEAEPEEDEVTQCGACGHTVAADEKFCPRCGATFEED